MWLHLATKHHLTTVHIVISSSSLFLGFHTLIQFFIFLSFLNQNTVSILFSGNNKLSITSKSSTCFLMSDFYNDERSLQSKYFNEKSSYSKNYLQLHKSENHQPGFCSADPSTGQKSASFFPCYQKKISLQEGRIKCWQNMFRTYWDNFLGMGEAPDHMIYSVHPWNNRGIPQVFAART